MNDSLQPGIQHELRFKVPPSKIVPSLYPESEEFQAMPDVFATGFFIGLVEWACIQSVNPYLDWPQEQTVGTYVDVSHEAATQEQYPEAHITVKGATDRQVRAIESINRALTELLINAVNHSDQTEPSVEVTVENRDDAVAIRIADDGPGIPEMERKIITENAEIEPLYHGTGLGLWLVKTIVENSGGSLAFDENEPWGTIVTITLPVAPAGGTDQCGKTTW